MDTLVANLWRKSLSLLISGVFVVQLAACGTLIYPERRGQSSGEMDPVIVILDAIGLLFFLIPGVAAFIIDFNTGAIYLPQGKSSQERLDKIRDGFKGATVETGSDGSTIVRVERSQLTPEAVEAVGRILGDETFSLRHPGLRIENLDRNSPTAHPATAWVTNGFRRAQFSM